MWNLALEFIQLVLRENGVWSVQTDMMQKLANDDRCRVPLNVRTSHTCEDEVPLMLLTPKCRSSRLNAFSMAVGRPVIGYL